MSTEDAAPHIDDFYHVFAEILLRLHAAFPVPTLLLVEDIHGPIRWDMTGIADRKSRACFETMLWLERYGLLTYRTCEPRSIGIEGAVLSQEGFVLLNEAITWTTGDTLSRIHALKEARRQLAYEDIATLLHDLLRANCSWGAPKPTAPLKPSVPLAVADVNEVSSENDIAH